MAKYNFNLRKKDSDTPTPIYIVIRWNNQKLVYPTFEKILPAYWNFDKQRVKQTKKYPEYPEFNYRLDKIKEQTSNIFRTFLNDNDNRQPTPKELKKELDKVFRKNKNIENKSLFNFIEYYINESKAQKKELTIKQYRNTLRHLKEYSGKLDFKDINLDFYNDFTSYLKSEKNLSINTVGKIIKTLKTFLNEATEREINTNFAFKSKKFKVISEQTEKIYLTSEELDRMYQLDLSNNKKLEKVRDLFLIGCYTALRFSDFSQIQTENIIKNGQQIKIKTKKTGETVIIPLHYRVKEILKKYDNKPPKAISNQKMNEYIKEVGRLAKIDDIVIKSEQKGNLRIDKKFKKYELISTHTARRSGATNMFLADIKPIEIMKITGHKTEKAFMKYIRITSEENANSLMNSKFFNKPLKIAK
ncbi:MAG: site-specific integrase [Bacteroidales bacterium]|nr:site-specific integrase [Bacteroidales bacterium]